MVQAYFWTYILQPWIWRHVPSKRRHLSIKLHGVTIQKTSFPYSFAVWAHVIVETTNTWRLQIVFCGIIMKTTAHNTRPRCTDVLQYTLRAAWAASHYPSDSVTCALEFTAPYSRVWTARRTYCSEHTELCGFVNAQYFATDGHLPTALFLYEYINTRWFLSRFLLHVISLHVSPWLSLPHAWKHSLFVIMSPF